MQRSSVATDRLLSDCVVTIGNTAGLASGLRPPLSPEAVCVDETNIKLRGLFESPFVVSLDREGYEISVCIESLMPLENPQNQPLLRRNDRLLIEPDADQRESVQLVYGIKSVQPDGQWRAKLNLSLMGPLCDAAVEHNGFPLVFPFVLGARAFDHCINLDGGQPFRVNGKFVQ